MFGISVYYRKIFVISPFSMKTFFPRNISWSRFGMNVNVWPFTISVLQLVILAMWLWLALSVWNWLYKWWTMSQWWALIVAIPIFIFFVIIAFFKISELSLLPFIAKIIRSYFLDTTRKFQIGRSKPDPLKVMIMKMKKNEQKEIILKKSQTIDTSKIDRLNRIMN